MPVENVIVLMLENRSFDHIFGYRGGVNGLTGTETNPLNPTQPPSTTNPVFKVSNAEPYSISAGEGPSHSLNAVTTQLYGTPATPAPGTHPTMNGFVASYRDSLQHDHVGHPTTEQLRVVMEAFAPGTLPALEALADNFVLCDNWFCEVPGPTMPNRMFMHMASSGGYVHNVWDHIFDEPTIYNRLLAADKSWASYFFDQNEIKQFSQVNTQAANFRDFETQFAQDLQNGSFPTYSFIVPRFFAKSGPVNSMHGPFDARPADQLVAEVYNALRSSPVWDTSLLVVTFDEHGGFYDHVEPPYQGIPNPDGINSPPPGDDESWVPHFAFDRLGPRVPTLLVSPYVAKGLVCSDRLQHTSVLATLHDLFGTQPLTERDASAASFAHLLQPQGRGDTPLQIHSVGQIHSPTPFGSGVETDRGSFGLDSMQRELVQGAHRRRGLSTSIASVPHTQRAAADFVRG